MTDSMKKAISSASSLALPVDQETTSQDTQTDTLIVSDASITSMAQLITALDKWRKENHR